MNSAVKMIINMLDRTKSIVHKKNAPNSNVTAEDF
jgi:hypothetical protein